MRVLIGLLLLATALIAQPAAAQTTQYTFTGGAYDTISNSTTCSVGECTTFLPGMRVTATLTYAAPLAPNLPVEDRSAGVTAYTFSDGVRTTTGPADDAALYRVIFGTDAAGAPVNVTITLERTPGPPYTINDDADPNSYISYVNFTVNRTSTRANTLCWRRGPDYSNASPGPGSCSGDITNANSSTAFQDAPFTVTVTPAAPVPTLTEWAMILLGLMLAGGAALVLERRRLRHPV